MRQTRLGRGPGPPEAGAGGSFSRLVAGGDPDGVLERAELGADLGRVRMVEVIQDRE